MGQFIEVKCMNCDYKATFTTGAGFLDNSLENVSARFEENVAKHIIYISQTFQVATFHYERKIAFCPTCNILKDIPVISIEYNNNSKFNHGLSCDKCAADYTFITPIHEICNQNCPQCRTGTLLNCGFGFWD